MKLRLILTLALLLAWEAAPRLQETLPSWTAVCVPNGNTTGACPMVISPNPAWPAARGYNWRIPFDTVNREFLYFGAATNNPSIYSSALFGYSTVTRSFTMRASNGNTLLNPNDCGGPTNTGTNQTAAKGYNPLAGHPLGMMAFDSIRKIWINQGGLCSNYSNAFTSIYDAVTKTMRPLLPKWEFSPSQDGQFDGAGHSWGQGMEFVEQYGKTIICCTGPKDLGFRVTEFDGTNYTDVTALQQGERPTLPFSGGGLVSDGASLWVFGGCRGMSPGNGSITGYKCSGTPSNDLYRYSPSTYTWTKLAPVNGVKPSGTYASFPMLAYDSRRDRLVYYDPGTRELWQYVIATNTWSTFQASGSGPDHSNLTGIVSVGSSNTAGYDPHTDTMVVMYSLGQIRTPGVYELSFAGTTSSSALAPPGNLRVVASGTTPPPDPNPPPEPTPQPTPPPDTSSGGLTISNVQLSEVTQSSAVLTWTTNVAATTYVDHGTNASALNPPAPVNTSMNAQLVTAHRVVLYNLFYSTTYYYRVRSTSATGTTVQTSISSFKTLLNTGEKEPPTIPTNVTAAPAGPNAINLSWGASTDNVGVIGYRVFRNGSLVWVVFPPQTTLQDIGLAASNTYSYSVNAFDAVGNGSQMTVPVYANTTSSDPNDRVAPTIPANLRAESVTTSEISLAWSPSTDSGSGVKSYRVYRNNVHFATVAHPTTTYVDKNLPAQASFSYAVAAVDAVTNISPRSPALVVTTAVEPADTTAPTTPATVQVQALSSGRVRVSWQASTDSGTAGLGWYRVLRNGVQVGTTSADVTWYVSTGLTPGTSYVFSVVAVDNAGNPSAAGASAPVITPAREALPTALNVPLTVQEAIYPGISGMTRTQDFVTVGIPLPESAGVVSEAQLGLAGAAVGQFRITGTWPSGRAKWVLVDTLADVPGGGLSSAVALTSGSGNFGGTPLATDNGTTISINTGAAQFVVRKANFNVIESAVVNGTTIVSPGSSKGLVLIGPSAGQFACGTCATEYTSANDGASSAFIEENGPVRTVIKATGQHKSSSGARYMSFTVRLTFYRNRGSVKVTSELRNTDYGASNTYNSSYKGFESYDLQVTNAAAGTKTFAFGTHGAPATGTLSGTDSAYLYQGSSNSMMHQHWGSVYTVPPTGDPYTYSVVRNGAVVAGGETTTALKQYPQGWADVRNASGAGIGIGVYQLSAYWPKSLEFNAGGSDVRIGIWPRQSSTPYVQAWPQYSIHDLYLNFHGTQVASPGDDFFKWQHYLVARASRDHYNAAKVFQYPLTDPAEEDAYFNATGASASPAISNPAKWCCMQDLGVSNISMYPITVSRYYGWGSAGGGNWSNEFENRWSFLLNFLTRGMTGRYLTAAHFYRYQAEETFPRSDGFSWRDRPLSELNALGFPGRIVSANSVDELGKPTADRGWIDGEHAHWYGMTDYYFMTGDESIRDAILDGPKDRFLHPLIAVNNGQMYNTRGVGHQLAGTARLSTFLSSIGDPDADAVLAQGLRTYELQVQPELCVDGYPTGCSYGDKYKYNTWTTQGVSRGRGMHYGASGLFDSCPAFGGARGISALFQAILLQGLWEFREAKGTSWSEYENVGDLLDGMSMFSLTELFRDDGTGNWQDNHVRNGLNIDVPNSCWLPYTNKDYIGSTIWFPFYVQAQTRGSLAWEGKFQTVLRKVMFAGGMSYLPEVSSYQTSIAVDALKRPPAAAKAVPVTVTGSGGVYTISWTVPAGAKRYQIKWSTKRIVEWIGFDAGTHTWIGDPVNTINWFAANNVSNEPVPGAAGTVQTYTLSGLPTGLTAANFSVKAFVK